MSLIGAEGLDAAILPIGDLLTMGPSDSVKAAGILGAKKILPAHYNTWEPIEQDASKWSDMIRTSAGAEPITPEVGETVAI